MSRSLLSLNSFLTIGPYLLVVALISHSDENLNTLIIVDKHLVTKMLSELVNVYVDIWITYKPKFLKEKKDFSITVDVPVTVDISSSRLWM